MEVGDLVRYQDRTWRIYKRDRQVRTFQLLHWDKTSAEVADNDPNLILVASPAKDWPFVALPRRSETQGRIELITRTLRGVVIDLFPNTDWVPSDPLRAGGSLFFHPGIGLRQGEVLSAKYENGLLVKVPITRGFGTIDERKTRQRSSRPKAPTVWGHLLDDNED